MLLNTGFLKRFGIGGNTSVVNMSAGHTQNVAVPAAGQQTGTDQGKMSGAADDDTICNRRIALNGSGKACNTPSNPNASMDWSNSTTADSMVFDITQDQLLMVCDLTHNPDPEIEVISDMQTPGLSHILMDGTEIARVFAEKRLTPDDIVLIDHSDSSAFDLQTNQLR